jgi:hypothetical protein
LFIERLKGGIEIKSLLLLLLYICLKTAKDVDVAKEKEAKVVDYNQGVVLNIGLLLKVTSLWINA